MRILILTISYTPNIGGVETHLNDLVRWLEACKDFEIDVLTYQPITTQARGPKFEQHDRLRIFRIPWIGWNLFHRFETKPVLQFLYLAPRLLLASIWHLLNYRKYDVIHAHGLTALWVAGQLKRHWNIPVLASLHTIYLFEPNSFTGQRIRRVLQKADHLLSCAAKGVTQTTAYGLDATRVGQFTYWVNQQIFCPHSKTESLKQYSLPTDKMICLFVGRLIEVKGVHIVLELARQLPNILFLTVGDGPMEKHCMDAECQFSNFRHMGCIADKNLARLYSASDLLLVPSLFTEGIPRVICEALSCGLPVIGSDRGGTQEALNSEIGILTEPATNSFSLAIQEWQQRGGTTSSVREACRTFAIKNFGSGNAQVIEACLRRLAQT